jgi:membrane fusion protein (multidrug efflux system)
LLTTVSQIDPILFRAGISEAEYLGIARRADELRAARGGQKIPIELVLADGSVHPETGVLDAVERAIDATTGTLTMQFKFPNPGNLVRPGQYGRARFILESKKDAMLVPQRAVQEMQNLYSVAVVGADNKVTFKTVTMGPRMGSLWVVESGLQGNERVVVAGLQRLRDGMTVTPKPAPPSPEGSGQPGPGPAAAGER